MGKNCNQRSETAFHVSSELCPEFIINKNMIHNGLKVLSQFDKLFEKQLRSHSILTILVLETCMTAFS